MLNKVFEWPWESLCNVMSLYVKDGPHDTNCYQWYSYMSVYIESKMGLSITESVTYQVLESKSWNEDDAFTIQEMENLFSILWFYTKVYLTMSPKALSNDFSLYLMPCFLQSDMQRGFTLSKLCLGMVGNKLK